MIIFPQCSELEMARQTLRLLVKIDADERISDATGIPIGSLQEHFRRPDLYALRIISGKKPSNLAYIANALVK